MCTQLGRADKKQVYQAGHMVPSYQPEAAWLIFMRALKHRDIATGEVDLNEYAANHAGQYSTSGPSDTWWMKNDVLPQTPHQCYILDPDSRCSEEEKSWIKDGTAIVKDWILIGRDVKNGTALVDGRREEGQAPFKADL